MRDQLSILAEGKATNKANAVFSSVFDNRVAQDIVEGSGALSLVISITKKGNAANITFVLEGFSADPGTGTSLTPVYTQDIGTLAGNSDKGVTLQARLAKVGNNTARFFRLKATGTAAHTGAGNVPEFDADLTTPKPNVHFHQTASGKGVAASTSTAPVRHQPDVLGTVES